MGCEPNTDTNEAERRRWNDERWAAVWPKRERLTDAVTPFVLDAAALGPGQHVLDIGCGGGKTTLAAAQVVGGNGAVVGADVSAPLLALATQRAKKADVDKRRVPPRRYADRHGRGRAVRCRAEPVRRDVLR